MAGGKKDIMKFAEAWSHLSDEEVDSMKKTVDAIRKKFTEEIKMICADSNFIIDFLKNKYGAVSVLKELNALRLFLTNL